MIESPDTVLFQLSFGPSRLRRVSLYLAPHAQVGNKCRENGWMWRRRRRSGVIVEEVAGAPGFDHRISEDDEETTLLVTSGH